MNQKILVLDVGLGNVGSICNMFKYIGFKACRGSSIDQLAESSKIILPGVGAFDAGMQRLQDAGMVEPLKILADRPDVIILGICLGMHLLFDGSEEGNLPGLGLIPGSVKRFIPGQKKIKVPHMGWNSVEVPRPSRLLSNGDANLRFYFVHSYYVDCKQANNVVGYTRHGVCFPSVVERNNILGVQFHPEKSHRYGMALLKSFAEL